jgi:hypothetical protein
LKEAVSTYGKISNASMRAVPNGLDCCDIEFEVVNECNMIPKPILFLFLARFSSPYYTSV